MEPLTQEEVLELIEKLRSLAEKLGAVVEEKPTGGLSLADRTAAGAFGGRDKSHWSVD
jgi:hypothetical protein